MLRTCALVAAGTLRIYLQRRVSRAAAALSYFLMLTIFPLLVCLYEMLGGLFPTAAAVEHFFDDLLPGDAVSTIMDYLAYISDNNSRSMFSIAVLSMATSSAAAFRILDYIMGEIRGQRRYVGPLSVLFSFGFSLIFLAAIYFAVVVMLSGNWFLEYIDAHLPLINISSNWRWARFVLLFLLLFVIVLGIYRLTAPKKPNIHLFSGAVLASAALVMVSILFSYFIGMSVKYSLIYGSLASVMILLLWLYLCGNIVIGGNIVNVVLERLS